ncbi:porin [Erythrobacter sp. Alg231-14]|uniref:porin n=1 Tax=Erythrobacter sp. Alg231-14 TaxID=1922225 RepID=UPI000D54E8D4
MTKICKPLFVSVALLSSSVSTQAVAQATPTASEEMALLRTELARLANRLAELESELAATTQAANEAAEAAEAASASVQAVSADQSDAAEVEFRGAPQVSNSDGWSFKPRGRVNMDFGYVGAPSSTGADSGFDAEARRVRLGVSGDIPGGFGYKVEADFAENEVALTDAIITYKDGGLTLSVGQHNTFQGLEELSSSLNTSFIERSAWTDAFGFERRVGVSGQYKTDTLLLQGGVFSDNSEDLPNGNTSFDGRVVFAPVTGSTQLHFGGSVHYNDLGDGNTVRYRTRPLVHFTDNRFVNTDRFSANSELGIGLEAAAISGPFHIAIEGFSQSVDRPIGFADPSFLGASAEVGLFLTEGDTRGYKIGTFGRVKPQNPVGEGGSGAIQLNLRYDYLDLNDEDIIGGTQESLQASLIWTFTDYTRLLLNYGLLSYGDSALPQANGNGSYDVHVVGLRAQVDF